MNRTRYDVLYRIAVVQRGMFTARQAIEAGFDNKNHHYHVKTGHWEREQRGVYRLKNFPYEPASQYVMWSLWSRDREGRPQGVYSYETALSIYELSDLNPAKISMTVPPNFRRGTPVPKILVLYRVKLEPKDWRDMGGYRVTTPVRTLYDVINSKHISEEFIYQTVREGFSRGMYSKSKLTEYNILKQVNRYR